MQIALIQMPVTADRQENLHVARRCLEEAAAQKVDLAVLPEMFCCPYENACFRTYGEPEGGPAQEALRKAAAELGIYVVGGSLPELEEHRVYNTSYVFGPDGTQLAKHRKVHLFDIDVAGGNPSGSPTRFPREMPSPHLKLPSAPWAFASALTCALRSWRGACVCAGPRCSSSPPPSI